MAVDKSTAKLIARIAENLLQDIPDDVMQAWIENPRPLKRVLAALSDGIPGCPEVETWTSLKDLRLRVSYERDLGNGRAIIRHFGESNVSQNAIEMLKSRDFLVGRPGSTNPHMVLVSTSAASLGFDKGAYLGEFCSVAETFGFMKCPPDVGPLLRSHYHWQSVSKGLEDGLRIAMDTMLVGTGQKSERCVFDLHHSPSKGLCLGDWGNGTSGGDIWCGNCEWVFLRDNRLP